MASLKKRTLKSGETYYLQHYVGGKRQKLINLNTDSVEIAEEEQRSFESAKFRGAANPFPSETPPATILTEYIRDIRTRRPKKSVQNEIYYLRDIFGSCCDELKITSRKLTPQRKSRLGKPLEDRRCKPLVLNPQFIEHIKTSDISRLIQSRVESRGLAPKTANHYRAILRQLLNWAVKEREVRLPGGLNPANNVKPYSERAPIIVFLEVDQIDRQLEALNDLPQLQAAVATYIYAGLRREELLWLTHQDINWKSQPYGTIRIRAKTMGVPKDWGDGIIG